MAGSVLTWLGTPIAAPPFDGRPPRDLLGTPDETEVHRRLRAWLGEQRDAAPNASVETHAPPPADKARVDLDAALPDDDERSTGYYWIWAEGDWEPAHWDAGRQRWLLIGAETPLPWSPEVGPPVTGPGGSNG